ncbi:hypothetical protein EGW08_004848 [Elysia chlorotica]|uniref:Uncharacterized protein n=1 Tax=Elysia chlorotica TaxID=188477 RepID=A0A3S1BS28_ELYCH|nr:hypothetical protein EGW08_004848 [Elysia chlorotica]
MNSFTASLAVAAILVFSTSATPCTDICLSECAFTLQSCQLIGTPADLCASENEICTKDCDFSCNCIDICAEKCGSAFAACKGDGIDLLKLESCSITLEVCEVQCGTECGMNNLIESV